jgi:hypothetical protein
MDVSEWYRACRLVPATMEAIVTIEMTRIDEMTGVGSMHDDIADHEAADAVASWDDLDASEWIPADLTAILDEFADRFLPGGSVAHPVASSPLISMRMWRSVNPDVSLGRQVGFEVAELLATYPDIHASGVAVLCDRHRDGLEAAKVIEACGIAMEHSFTADRRERVDAWRRLPWNGIGVKGCRTDQFTSDAVASAPSIVVLGIGSKPHSPERFHAALAHLARMPHDRPVLVAVVNSHPDLAAFAGVFTDGVPTVEAAHTDASMNEPSMNEPSMSDPVMGEPLLFDATVATAAVWPAPKAADRVDEPI